ncbi:hypothetical protein PAHAL_6G003500 [Panicum hallii]|uniref:Uncharacterized protein n=1 Tax=Panicum hallii TaxID=206008 RepID=A0A2T8IEN2_9POAL|nr:hypothetical protein PAHAL_6G003500 [Panicum hallii]
MAMALLGYLQQQQQLLVVHGTVAAQPLLLLLLSHGRDGLLLLHLGSAPTLVVSSPSAAEAVLRTHDHVLASRTWSPVADIIFYGLTDVAFAPYGERWRQARKLLTTHMLSAKKVHSFRHGRLEEVRVVLARIRDAAATAPRTVVDMTGLLGGYTNDVVSRAVLGESHREGGRNRLFGELSEINVSLLLAKLELLRKLICAKAKRVHRRWDQLFDKLIDEHQRERKRASSSQHEQQEEITDQDFIHVLLSVREEYGLTMDGVKAILVDMFEAGIETAHLVLDYAMAELMINKHVMTQLQKEVRRCAPAGNDMVVMEEDLSNMAYLKAVVKETLRLHPPVPLLVPHLSIADCEVNGYPVPSGTRVFVNVWSLGRDPEFMPERFLEGGCAADVDMKGKDFQFLSFGSGRRICPGINFGVATVEIMLANLMYHFDWDLQDDMTELFGLTLRRKEKLILVSKVST